LTLVLIFGNNNNNNNNNNSNSLDGILLNVWWGDLREGDHTEDPGVDGRMI
jgi:hypothetical protein